MTHVQAKDYAITHLPCTVSALTTLFLSDLGTHIRFDKVVGLSPKSLGYTMLVFYFQYTKHTPASPLPVQRYMLWWFKTQHGFTVQKHTHHEDEDQIWWVVPPVEIKEDRGI